MGYSARESGAGSHAAGKTAAANVAAAEGSVSTEATGVPATETAVTSAAALRPHGNSKRKRKCRDRHQAAHSKIIRSALWRDCQILFPRCA